MTKRTVPQAVFDSPAAIRAAKAGHAAATRELAETPRHLLGEGNPNHPRYDAPAKSRAALPVEDIIAPDDVPTTCPHCGARTVMGQGPQDGVSQEQCADPACGQRFNVHLENDGPPLSADEGRWLTAFDSEMQKQYAVGWRDLGPTERELVDRYGDLDPPEAAAEFGEDYDLTRLTHWR